MLPVFSPAGKGNVSSTNMTTTKLLETNGNADALPNGKHKAGNGTSWSAAKAWAREKLSQMTIEEKVTLLAGEDLWRTHPIPRLGVPRLKTSDGPVGVRGGIFLDGQTAASLPSGYVPTVPD